MGKKEDEIRGGNDRLVGIDTIGGKRKTGGRAKVEKWRQWVKYLVPVFFFFLSRDQ